MTKEKKPVRRKQGPLWLDHILRGGAPGLLCDERAEVLNDAERVIAFAEQEGIDPKAEGFWFRLALHLLHKHEPAFQTEPRGRPAADRSTVRGARRELIELYIADNMPRIAEGLKPLSDSEFVKNLISHVGRKRLPSYYRKTKARTLRQELALARGELKLFTDVHVEIMNNLGVNELGLPELANFAALYRPKRAGGKVGEK
jgi:hypothetical protein